MKYGIEESVETLTIESELAAIQQKAGELHNQRNMINKKIDALSENEINGLNDHG